MANTIAGVNPTRIAQLSLDVLSTMPLPFDAFTTDFSPDIAQSGDTVVTRYADNPSVTDFNSSKAVGNRTLTAVTTVLQHYAGVPIGFTDKEMAFSDIRLMELYIKPSLTALFVNVFGNVTARITNANFSQNTICNATNFNVAHVANVGTNLTKANVLPDGRHLVINPDMALTLKKDTALQAAYAYGGNQTVTTGQIPQVYGFQVHEFNGTIPTNSENLIGFACRPQGLVLAARVPQQPSDWYGRVQNITDPRSGLTVQFRSYYDGSVQRYEWCLIYGSAVGIATNLWRILSS